MVYFMDAAGDDLPAAQVSGVSVDGLALQINDTGETWVGNGPLTGQQRSYEARGILHAQRPGFVRGRA